MTQINGLAVTCPTCSAHAGKRCRTSGNVVLDEPHRKRMKAAALHQRADAFLDELLQEAS